MMISKLLRERKDIYWFLAFALVGLFYYGIRLIITDYHIVHLPIDDKIPFIPAFIIPYVIWYAYIPGMMVLTFFKSKTAFVRQQYAFYTGVAISCLVFVVYPTVVDFRPDAQGDGVLLWMVRFIYANDMPPSNVFPSLHCFQALSVHLTAFTVGPFKRSAFARSASAILVLLICLSTVFVKQHSFIDVIAGCALAVLTAVIFTFVLRGNKNESDN